MDFVGAADKGCDDSRVSWASLKIDNERERYIYIYIYMRWLKTLWSMRIRVGVFLLL